MPIILKIQNSLNSATNMLSHIEIISNAIHDGLDSLKKNYPHSCDDLAVLCEELRKSLDAIVSASKIISHFNFIEGNAEEADLDRFHSHLEKHKKKAAKIEQQIDAIRGSGYTIFHYAEKIRDKVDLRHNLAVSKIFNLFFQESGYDLEEMFEHVCNEQQQYQEIAYSMTTAVKDTLEAIENELGPPGIIHKEKVPRAAAMLNSCALLFEELEARSEISAEKLQASIDSLHQSLGS